MGSCCSCCSKGQDIVDYSPDIQPPPPPHADEAANVAVVEEQIVEPVTPDTLDASVAGTTLEHIADREGITEG